MTFGFPAHHTEMTDLDVDRVAAREAICQSFDDLGWRYQMIDVDTYHGRVRMTGESWGEEFEVSLSDPGVMRLESTSLLITQCLDFGKNRRNVEQFLANFKMRCIGVIRNSLPVHPPIDEQGKTPLERLISDDGT